MFKEQLKADLEKIFGFKKTTFEAPSDTYEQDTLFVEIVECRTRATQGTVYAKVSGILVTYSNKIPFGYMTKRVGLPQSLEAAKNFFIEPEREIAMSAARLLNIAERRTNFTFLYQAPYNPATDSMEGIDFEIVEEGTDLIDIGDGSNLDAGDGRLIST